MGIGYWLTSPEVAYQLISAIILGWSVSYAWIQLIVSGYGRIGKIAGIFLFLAGAIHVRCDSYRLYQSVR